MLSPEDLERLTQWLANEDMQERTELALRPHGVDEMHKPMVNAVFDKRVAPAWLRLKCTQEFQLPRVRSSSAQEQVRHLSRSPSYDGVTVAQGSKTIYRNVGGFRSWTGPPGQMVA